MFRRYRIEGHSMEPRYPRGSSVLVWKTKHVHEGDVIAFKCYPPTSNDRRSDLPSLDKKVLIKRIRKQSGKDILYVEGDNTTDSLDVGPIRREQIIGRVVFSY